MFPSDQTFLSTTLKGTSDQLSFSHPTPVATGTLNWLSSGIIAFHYQPVSPCSLIISAGIHGDETAPIELLDKLVSDVITGTLQPRKNCLFILGNPPAIARNVRFIDRNLNRLFCSETERLDTPKSSPNSEAFRAREIMQAVNKLARYSKSILHYDLHTTIRPSVFERFAIFPYVPARGCSHNQLAFLARSRIEALVNQNHITPTFSSWTATEHGAESFTLELGSVHKFGQNSPETTQALDKELREFLSSEETIPAITPRPSSYPQQFSVIHEITNTGKGFKLKIDKNAANFSQYNFGYEIWSDRDESYRVADDPVFIVFPNSQVGEGERAGLLVKRSPIILV